MLRLLQINQCLNLSTGKIAQQIGEMALGKGWESWIAYSGREKEIQSKSNLIRVGSYIDSCVHYANQRIFDREGLSSSLATKRLINIVSDIKPDVIHLHNIHDHWLNYKILFKYLNTTDIKVVWTFHDCWAFTGHCFHFVTKKCERWKKECYDCPLQREYPKSYLDRSRKNFELKKSLFSSCQNLTIVACSEWMAGLVRESFLKDKRIEVIHNGIDLMTFIPSKAKLDDGKFRILAVSNVWNKEKGFFDLMRLRKILPSDYEITIVGLNKKQLSAIPEGIKGIERTQNVQELVELYSSSDLLINTTYADTFPTINIESLACGTPVVTYRTGGSPEILDDRTGVVVEQGNVEAMAQTIKWLRQKPLNAEDCRTRAESNFEKFERFQDYIKLYEQILNK